MWEAERFFFLLNIERRIHLQWYSCLSRWSWILVIASFTSGCSTTATRREFSHHCFCVRLTNDLIISTILPEVRSIILTWVVRKCVKVALAWMNADVGIIGTSIIYLGGDAYDHFRHAVQWFQLCDKGQLRADKTKICEVYFMLKVPCQIEPKKSISHQMRCNFLFVSYWQLSERIFTLPIYSKIFQFDVIRKHGIEWNVTSLEILLLQI